MVSQQFRCPHCKKIAPFTGDPGEVKQIYCPYCGSKGKVRFAGEKQQVNYAIEVSKLKKIYGELIAVNSISFKVKQGEIFAFLGPNGAGKTTTVEMIESIREPTTGNIKLLGMDIRTHFNEVKKNIGILPQEFHSYERLTVHETLEYFSKLYEKRANIDTIIDAMDLRPQEKQLYRTLSGGLKQRVGVAIALVNDPQIVFLDEPTTGLDPKARREVWEVIAGLRDKGKTVFLTTHYMEEAEYLADHIAIIHQGQIIAEGSLEDLITQYGTGNILQIQRCQTKNVGKILKENGFHVISEKNDTISIKIDHKERVLEVLSQLRHDCIDYGSIDIRRTNLEEIFLNLTGRRLSEDEQ
jgi:ABC-2 type transport system ATP-binding protein